MKNIYIIIGVCIIIFIAFILFEKAQKQSTYNGLPTVPCLDYTESIKQNFSLTIHIKINGKTYPINKTMGHDYGNCLHDIFVNDESGRVFIKANDMESFTLGQFFDVWHKTFSEKQIFNYETDNTHKISIIVNNKQDLGYRNIILRPNEDIEIQYE